MQARLIFSAAAPGYPAALFALFCRDLSSGDRARGQDTEARATPKRRITSARNRSGLISRRPPEAEMAQEKLKGG